jgi:hypothetical protein
MKLMNSQLICGVCVGLQIIKQAEGIWDTQRAELKSRTTFVGGDSFKAGIARLLPCVLLSGFLLENTRDVSVLFYPHCLPQKDNLSEEGCNGYLRSEGKDDVVMWGRAGRNDQLLSCGIDSGNHSSRGYK